MKTLYLIRHAQSAANAGGISLPDREIPLSAEGARQAAELACRLPENRHVFVSEMRRTHETATPYCARHDVRPEILPCLNEFSYLPFAAVQGLDASARKPLAQAYWQRADPHCSACLKTLRNFDAARKAACTFREFKVQAAFGSGSG